MDDEEIKKTFSRRLNRAMRDVNATVLDLHKAAGVTYEMARRYTTASAMPRREKIPLIAAFLQCTETYLLGYEDESSDDPIPAPRRIPVRSMVHIIGDRAQGFDYMANVPAGIYGRNAYGYKLHSDCMEGARGREDRYIEQNAFLIIDPDYPPANNKVVLAVTNNDAIVGHYNRYAGVITVRPSNPRYPPIIVAEDQIRGVVMRAITTFVEQVNPVDTL